MRCERPPKPQKTQTLRNKGPFFSPTSPCWSGIGLESALMRAISSCDLCDNKTMQVVCSRRTRETDGIAAKLLQCGITSEALQRNLPLSSKICHHIFQKKEESGNSPLGLLKCLYLYIFLYLSVFFYQDLSEPIYLFDLLIYILLRIYIYIYLFLFFLFSPSLLVHPPLSLSLSGSAHLLGSHVSDHIEAVIL